MKKAILLPLLAVGSVVSFVGHKFHKAHCCSGSPDKHIRHIVNHLDKKLQLTPSQQESVTIALRTLWDGHQELKADTFNFKSELHSQFSGEVLDVEALQVQASETLISPVLSQVSSALEELHKTLSTAQRVELIRLIEKKHGRFGCCSH